MEEVDRGLIEGDAQSRPFTERRTRKPKDRGYIIIYLLYALFALTILFAIFIEYQSMIYTYQLAMYNGIAVPYLFDHQILNWIIAAEGTAVSIAAGMQAWKKKSNNTYEHIELMLDEWANRYGIEVIAPIAESFMSNNTNH